MQKFKQGKKLIISLLCLMLIALASFLCVKVIGYGKKLPLSQTSVTGEYSRVTAYDFSTDNLSDDDASKEIYNRYDYFKIDDYEGLLNFSYSVSYGHTFQSKTVYLAADIDRLAEGNCKNYNWQPIGTSMSWDSKNNCGKYLGNPGVFKGKFDGQGYTISNLNTNIGNDDVKAFIRVGLFGTVEGFYYQDVTMGIEGVLAVEIKNVKIKNFVIDINYSTWDSGWYASALIAEAKGLCIISNCIVEDFNFNLPADSHEPYFGGVVCCYETSSGNYTSGWLSWRNVGGNVYLQGIYTSALIMDNVLLNNIKVSDVEVEARDGYFSFLGPAITKTHTTTIGLLNMYTGFLGIERIVDSSELKNITNENFNIQYSASAYSDKQTYTYTPTLYYNNTILKDYSGSDAKTGEQYDIMNDNANYYQLLSNNLNYECWNDSTSNNLKITSALSEDDNWYVPTTTIFNKGCPYLTTFMKYKKYKFGVAKDCEKMGSVDCSQITVPDILKIFGSGKAIEPTISANKITLYGSSVKAESYAGHYFTEWTYNKTTNTYSANFDKENYYITFSFIDEKDNTFTDVGDSGGKYIVEYGQRIGNIKCFNAGDVNDWNIGEDMTLCIGLPLKYYVYSVEFGDETFTQGEVVQVPDLGKNRATYNVTVKVKLKSYGVEVS